jgi:hypothetical protein
VTVPVASWGSGLGMPDICRASGICPCALAAIKKIAAKAA